MESYDVYNVRGSYTSLSDGWTYLNAHDRPQIPERVAGAVARSFRTAASATRPEVTFGHHAQSAPLGMPEADSYIQSARLAVADLVGGRPEAVVLGPSLPVLYSSLARACVPMLRRSSVVLSRLDAPELSAPFSTIGDDVRWAVPDLGTGELPAWQYRDLVDGSTRLVAIPAAHGLIGTVTPVAEIAEEVRALSRAWVLVDASAYAPYRPISIRDWGVDIVAVDLAQLGGPEIAAIVFRDPLMFKRIDRVNFAPGIPSDSAATLETRVSPGLAGGAAPIVDHLASLTPSSGTRRHQLENSMGALQAHLDSLRDDLYLFLGSLPSVHILGVSGEAAADADRSNRLPRASFAVRGVDAETVYRRLLDNNLLTTITPRTDLLVDMGIEEVGGTVTVGLSPFTTSADLDHLVRVVASLA